MPFILKNKYHRINDIKLFSCAFKSENFNFGVSYIPVLIHVNIQFSSLLWHHCFLQSFYINSLAIDFQMLSYSNALWILGTTLFLTVHFANIFYKSMHSHCILILVSLAMQKILGLIKFHLFIFAFILIAVGEVLKKILWFMSECSVYILLKYCYSIQPYIQDFISFCVNFYVWH